MNTTHTNESRSTDQTFAHRCLQSCKELLAGLEQARSRIAGEFQETLESSGHLVQLALNEAEAQAWQTPYPHLFFPTLAVEKLQAVAVWQARQQSVQRHHSVLG